MRRKMHDAVVRTRVETLDAYIADTERRMAEDRITVKRCKVELAQLIRYDERLRRDEEAVAVKARRTG